MLVSAIMPTQNRRSFIPRAVESFLNQDWPEKELIVIDSGIDRVDDLFVGVPGAKYIYYREENRPSYLPHTPIGTKRNIACENASGEVIFHWDDDDVSQPNRMTNQLEILKATGKSVSGYNPILNLKIAAGTYGEYKVPDGMVCGTSLCYRREYWQGHKFKNTSFGEDWMFAEEAQELGQLAVADGRDFIVATTHPGNTCQRV